MRKLYIYILALLALSVSCQRLELPEELPTDKPTGAVGTKATITFSTAELMDEQTKAIVDPSVDVATLHLILFDENGMYVETCEATKLGSSDHGDHHSGRHYTVTLTLTDQPRIIHFVANCPVDQIIYGHEASVIGNMYVDKNDRPHVTTYETAYWARIEVPFIKVQEDETTKKVSLHPDIVYKFNHVPLLRNYAEITVESSITDNTFEFLGYTVYNVLDRGTVAPYNSNTQKFQSFIYHPNPEAEAIASYSYPQLSNLSYEGHALTSAELITDFPRDANGDVIDFHLVENADGSKTAEPFYIYERKVSVMTDAEEEWKESPPHIIIKGRYNHGEPVTDSSPVYYYKMDLVYTATDGEHQEIKYYNILRNFSYHFYITDVHDEGYTDIAGAISGPAGNNLSGSTTTSKLTNVSDNAGRLWVSYTDTTLVNGNAISLKYKYIPNYYNDSEPETYQKIRNDLVRFGNVEGDVIASIDISDGDITGTGTWGGYRNVILHIKEPGDISQKQILELRTDNVHLTRDVRYTLCKKLNMEVECTPKVAKSMMQPVQVDIKLPMGLTEDMFPLELDIETFARTLSPDPVNNGTTIIPVKAGPSIIDVDGRRGQQSYFYTLTIPTLAAYKALDTEGNTKVYHTYWLTNKEDNASTIYVDNKYFHQASDSWVNYIYTFSNLSCTTSEVGVGKDVTLKFTMANGAYNTPVTISLVGMTYTGTLGATTYVDATEVKYTPTRSDVSISGFKTTTVQDKVSFTLDAEDYAIAKVEGERNTYKFNGAFGGDVTRFEQQAGVEADFEFNIPADAYHDGMVVYVTLNRLLPSESEDNLEYVVERAVGDKYLYRVKNSGKQTIRLETAGATEGECTVTLEADLFETEEVSVAQTDVTYEFGAEFNTQNPISIKTDVRVTFNIPSDAYVSGMKVKVTLDRLVPNNDANLESVGNGVYEYTVPNAENQEIKLKADKNEAGKCAVTLEASKYNFTLEKIEISQVQVSLEPQLTVIWKNDNVEYYPGDWKTYFRFGLDGRDDNNECIETFSQDVWNVIKNGTFYLKFRPTSNSFTLRIDTGWWDFQNINVTSGSNFIKNNVDGTYYILINFSDPSFCNGDIKDQLDDHHLLFTGTGYIPIELYCYM